MKKLLISLVLVLGMTYAVNAQFGFNFSGQVGMGKYFSAKIDEDMGFGAGMGLGCGIEYLFANKSMVWPFVGLDGNLNFTRKKWMENLLEDMGASEVSGGGFAHAGPYVGIKWMLPTVSDFRVYIETTANFEYGGPSNINYEMYLGNNKYSKHTLKFRNFWQFGGLFAIGVHLKCGGDFKIYYRISGLRPYYPSNDIVYAFPTYRENNLGFTYAWYFRSDKKENKLFQN